MFKIVDMNGRTCVTTFFSEEDAEAFLKNFLGDSYESGRSYYKILPE